MFYFFQSSLLNFIDSCTIGIFHKFKGPWPLVQRSGNIPDFLVAKKHLSGALKDEKNITNLSSASFVISIITVKAACTCIGTGIVPGIIYPLKFEAKLQQMTFYLFYLFNYFYEKIRLGISCKSST